jgi:hypothetical protein
MTTFIDKKEYLCRMISSYIISDKNLSNTMYIILYYNVFIIYIMTYYSRNKEFVKSYNLKYYHDNRDDLLAIRRKKPVKTYPLVPCEYCNSEYKHIQTHFKSNFHIKNKKSHIKDQYLNK